MIEKDDLIVALRAAAEAYTATGFFNYSSPDILEDAVKLAAPHQSLFDHYYGIKYPAKLMVDSGYVCMPYVVERNPDLNGLQILGWQNRGDRTSHLEDFPAGGTTIGLTHLSFNGSVLRYGAQPGPTSGFFIGGGPDGLYQAFDSPTFAAASLQVTQIAETLGLITLNTGLAISPFMVIRSGNEYTRILVKNGMPTLETGTLKIRGLRQHNKDVISIFYAHPKIPASNIGSPELHPEKDCLGSYPGARSAMENYVRNWANTMG
jgi:hypothetical protein